MPPFAAIAAELARELASRRENYPRLVSKGNLTQQQADHGILMAQAWAEDCQRYSAAAIARQAFLQSHHASAGAPASIDAIAKAARDVPAQCGAPYLTQDARRYPIANKGAFPWATRWRALQDELRRREKQYPNWIKQGQLDQADSAQRIERLTEMLHLYDEMVDWQPRNGTRPRPFAAKQTPAERESFDEAAPYLCDIMLRRHWITLDQARIDFPHHAPAEQKELSA
ncbi:hypothetical protein [Novosphingobium rosa]|uniref:hypothetical protein n=1 Tax=Novosphingobium rosa TaxID=76978 RepID=UPI00083515C9|nr:hypothetical protein [Novosphingobium rosa]